MLFDAGGVLVLPSGARLSAVFAQVGAQLPPDRCRDAWSRALADADQSGSLDREWVIRRWVHHAGAPRDLFDEACEALRAELDHERIAWHESVAEAAETLAALSEAGLRLGCVSNSDGSVEGELAILGLADYFETIVDSGIVGIEKPDPRIFALCLDQMGGLEPEECMFVGDTLYYDVTPASAAGLFACHFDRLGSYASPMRQGVRITQLRDLLAIATR